MGVPLDLKDILTGYLTASAYTSNNTLIEDAMNKALNREGGAGNEMLAALDMGLNTIDNLADATEPHQAINKRRFDDLASSFSTQMLYLVTAALGYRNEAEGFKNDAAGSASSASTSASNALTSENNAEQTLLNAIALYGSLQEVEQAVIDSATSATEALISENAAAQSAQDALDIYGSIAAVDQAVSDSENSAQAASTSESNAATSESNAATSESNAATSESNALGYREDTNSLFEDFKGTYYGPLGTAPTVDPFGNAIDAGDLYFDTGLEALYVYSGTAWVVPSPDIAAHVAATNPHIQYQLITTTSTDQTGELASWSIWLADSTTAVSRNLPTSPVDKEEVTIVDDAGNADLNNITVGRNGNTIMGLAEDLAIDKKGAVVTFKFLSAANDWRLV